MLHSVSAGTNQDASNVLTTSGVADAPKGSPQAVTPVDVDAVVGLKINAIKYCQTGTTKKNVTKLVMAVGLQMQVANNLVKGLKSTPHQEQKLIEGLVDKVFSKAGDNPECLKKIEGLLGVHKVENSCGKDVRVVPELSPSQLPKLSEDEYINSLRDSSLDYQRKSCEHVEYDMLSGRYMYHAPMTSKYSRPSSEVGYAFSRHRNSGPQNPHGRVIKHSSGSCISAHQALSNNSGTDGGFVTGDTIAIRQFAMLDTYASGMMSLLNSLRSVIEQYGLPDKQTLVAKVAVADGYRASYILGAQWCVNHWAWQIEVNSDDLLMPGNLLSITFKTKNDLLKIVSSGKSIGDFEPAGEVIISLKSEYLAEDHERVLHCARSLSVQPEDYHDNKPNQVDCTTYFFENGKFGTGFGGGK